MENYLAAQQRSPMPDYLEAEHTQQAIERTAAHAAQQYAAGSIAQITAINADGSLECTGLDGAQAGTGSVNIPGSTLSNINTTQGVNYSVGSWVTLEYSSGVHQVVGYGAFGAGGTAIEGTSGGPGSGGSSGGGTVGGTTSFTGNPPPTPQLSLMNAIPAGQYQMDGTIRTVYAGREVILNSSATTVSTSSLGTITYQWYYSPQSAPPYTFTPISGATSETYTISSFSNSSNSGTYQCIATNSYGSTSSLILTLGLNTTPIANYLDSSSSTITPANFNFCYINISGAAGGYYAGGTGIVETGDIGIGASFVLKVPTTSGDVWQGWTGGGGYNGGGGGASLVKQNGTIVAVAGGGGGAGWLHSGHNASAPTSGSQTGAGGAANVGAGGGGIASAGANAVGSSATNVGGFQVPSISYQSIFKCTGAVQSFTSTENYVLKISAWAAGGAGAVPSFYNGTEGGGGAAGVVTISIIPGDVLTFYVGGGGVATSVYDGANGSSGGGATDIYLNGTLIMSLGGGGGGGISGAGFAGLATTSGGNGGSQGGLGGVSGSGGSAGNVYGSPPRNYVAVAEDAVTGYSGGGGGGILSAGGDAIGIVFTNHGGASGPAGLGGIAGSGGGAAGGWNRGGGGGYTDSHGFQGSGGGGGGYSGGGGGGGAGFFGGGGGGSYSSISSAILYSGSNNEPGNSLALPAGEVAGYGGRVQAYAGGNGSDGLVLLEFFGGGGINGGAGGGTIDGNTTHAGGGGGGGYNGGAGGTQGLGGLGGTSYMISGSTLDLAKPLGGDSTYNIPQAPPYTSGSGWIYLQFTQT